MKRDGRRAPPPDGRPVERKGPRRARQVLGAEAPAGWEPASVLLNRSRWTEDGRFLPAAASSSLLPSSLPPRPDTGQPPMPAQRGLPPAQPLPAVPAVPPALDLNPAALPPTAPLPPLPLGRPAVVRASAFEAVGAGGHAAASASALRGGAPGGEPARPGSAASASGPGAPGLKRRNGYAPGHWRDVLDAQGAVPGTGAGTAAQGAGATATGAAGAQPSRGGLTGPS